MIVRVLGTAGVHVPGGSSPRLERKARELLSILTVRAPAAVALDELARLLWDDPPPSAVKTLRAHLSRIRAALQAAAGPGADVERVGRDGYRLALAPTHRCRRRRGGAGPGPAPACRRAPRRRRRGPRRRPRAVAGRAGAAGHGRGGGAAAGLAAGAAAARAGAPRLRRGRR
ncbi:helix-turn-helix domain-containing protein [Dactylosporangium sp. NBC_01737]|nr:helix-turn-helix domain-containing protein [Dactylosporangium sp. NBC_01737]